MTKAGKLEREFAAWKKDIEARLAALEGTKTSKVTKPAAKVETKAEEKASEIVIEAKDDIVAKDAE